MQSKAVKLMMDITRHIGLYVKHMIDITRHIGLYVKQKMDITRHIRLYVTVFCMCLLSLSDSFMTFCTLIYIYIFFTIV